MTRLAATAAGLAIGVCGASAATPDVTTFHSAEWGVSLRYPADMTAGPTFKQNYFDRGAWRVSYAADTGPGTPIVAISLPDLEASDAGGVSTATAELRIGASRDPDVVASCLAYGMNSGNNVESDTRAIGGVDFTEVPDNGDAEMMKTFRTDDLRAVHGGACWAIDLVLFTGGTANKPPDYPPGAIGRLKDVMDTIRFD